ncbi:MAG: hypothetical protein CMK67_03195, partial [Pseudoalteromonas sp.]|nr:hypothetical protein [Pseudoalteromonas sp.]
DLEQLNNEIFALLSTRFYCLKIDHLIKRNGISCFENQIKIQKNNEKITLITYNLRMNFTVK